MKKSEQAYVSTISLNRDKEDSHLIRMTGNTDNVSLTKYLMVRGQLDKDLGWVLFPAYEMEFPAGTPDEPGVGEYHIQLLNAQGQVLSEKFFDIAPAHIDIHEPEGRTSLMSSPSFSEWLSLPEGVTSVVLSHSNNMLTGITRTLSVPKIVILSPGASGFLGQPNRPLILWNGQDSDGDVLHYMIQYSSKINGMGEPLWETIGMDLTCRQLAVSLNDVAGSNNARIRVLATDGFNTSTAVSPVFVVGNKPPKASILSPDSNVIFETGSRVVALGTAFDMEDGSLSPEDLTWNSNIDGFIGMGHQIDLAVLSPGIHEIILRGEDSSGQIGSAVITVHVTERINTQPIANAGSDRMISANQSTQLDGMGSKDDDGDALSFSWTIISKPEGSLPYLTGQNTARPGFIADMSGRYAIQLIVFDGKIGSVPDRVNVDVVGNRPPLADAGPDQIIRAGNNCRASITLNGSGSSDPDGDILTYRWSGSFGTVTGVTPTVDLGLGIYEITLTVDDGKGGTASDTVVITVFD